MIPRGWSLVVFLIILLLAGLIYVWWFWSPPAPSLAPSTVATPTPPLTSMPSG
jgi:hypothetical protein